MDEHLIQAAKLAGWYDLQLQMASQAELNRLAAFYRLAHRAGMERAAEICDSYKDLEKLGIAAPPAYVIGTSDCAEAIRAHAKNQPESTHDTGNV